MHDNDDADKKKADDAQRNAQLDFSGTGLHTVIVCEKKDNLAEKFTENGRAAYTCNMKTLKYNREAVFRYAQRWAFSRNPAYYDFSRIGGDCTNFASQCVYAGAGIMNFTPVYGWFYKTANDRTASWTGVEYFYRFLTENEGVGPFAEEVPLNRLEVGDIVQLGNETGDFYHSPVVVSVSNGIKIAAHSYDAFNRPLSTYNFARARGIHILGVRSAEND